MENQQPTPLIVLMEDTPLHSLPDRPFCGMPDCPCRRDDILWSEYIWTPWLSGLLTASEAIDLLDGNLPGEEWKA